MIQRLRVLRCHHDADLQRAARACGLADAALRRLHPGHTLIVYDGRDAVALMRYSQDGDTLTLHALAIHDRYRGVGLAYALLHHLERTAMRSGAQRVYMEVPEGPAARLLCDARGYVPETLADGRLRLQWQRRAAVPTAQR